MDMALPSEINESNIGVIEKKTIKIANKMIVALDEAINSWESKKPEEFKDRCEGYKKTYNALVSWEKKMLKCIGKKSNFETRVNRLLEFVDLCEEARWAWHREH